MSHEWDDGEVKTRLAILGATGSIGTQTLDVVRAHPDRLTVTLLAARGSDPVALDALAHSLGARGVVEERDGAAAVLDAVCADDVDLVVVGVPGFAALRPTLAALAAGKRVALATKEVLVVAGHLVRRYVPEGAGERLRPIDSEHCALWQCLLGEPRDAVTRVTLTASGGPFRELPLASLASVTPDAALRHPTWRMDPKVTIDSATLANKGFEVVEANRLFDIPFARVGVVIHPESVVHALVEYADGSVKAQLADPDMRLPIQYALLAPERPPGPARRLELDGLELRFKSADPARYPCLELVIEAGRRGGAYAVAVNAADEIAVERFLRGALRFTDIARELGRGLDLAARAGLGDEPELDAIVAFDAEVRRALGAPAPVA